MAKSSRAVKARLWIETLCGKDSTIPCHWCKKQLTWKQATLDHEPPKAAGGTWRSVVIACKECNQRRGEEFEEARRKAEAEAEAKK